MRVIIECKEVNYYKELALQVNYSKLLQKVDVQTEQIFQF